MGMILTFLPWLLFWVLLSHGKLFLSIVIALAASIAAVAAEKMAGRGPKILQIGTLTVFVIFLAAAAFLDRAWLGHWIKVLSNASLTLIVLVSILIGKPFTIQYARESVPRELWGTPEFLRANYVITWVWFVAFVINTAVFGLDHFIPSINVFVNWAIAICPILAAAKFTAWYSRRGK